MAMARKRLRVYNRIAVLCVLSDHIVMLMHVGTSDPAIKFGRRTLECDIILRKAYFVHRRLPKCSLFEGKDTINPTSAGAAPSRSRVLMV